MSYSTRTLDDAAPYGLHNPSRKVSFPNKTSFHHKTASQTRISFQNVFGATGLALIALTCGWTLYANLKSGSVEAGAELVERVAKSIPAGVPVVDIAASFDALIAAPAEVPAEVRKGYLALLDPAHLLGVTPGSFVKPAPMLAARSVVAAPVQVASADPADMPSLPTPAAPMIAKLAPTVPLPASRPAVALRIPNEPNPVLRAATAPRKTAVAAAAPAAEQQPSIFQRLFGLQPKQPGPMMAYAAPDGGVQSDGSDSSSARYDRYTAVYDIKAKTVYLPDGTRLEAHSGLGSRLDDPRFVHERMRGPTPPHLYDLTMRESLFHGVQALRLNPVGGSESIHGRTGLLAHTFMLGPNGDSNGCVSFRDYQAFLHAYRSGQIKRLAVVASAG